MASSSCKPKAARLINNTPSVVDLAGTKRGEVEAVRRHVEICLSVGFQYSNQNINEIIIEGAKIHRDNGPNLTLAPSARWSGTFSNFFGPPGEGPCSGTPSRKLTYRKRWKKMRFWK